MKSVRAVIFSAIIGQFLFPICAEHGAYAGQLAHKTTIFEEKSEDSSELITAPKDADLDVIGAEVESEGTRWFPVKYEGKSGFVRSRNVILTDGDVGFIRDDRERDRLLGSNLTWHLQTSPVGLVESRYNAQISRFFGSSFAIGLKATIIHDAPQSVFGSDDGVEAGAQAAFYYPLGKAKIVLKPGLYYANFKRGNYLDDAASYTLQSGTIDRDEVHGPMVEGLGGLLFWINSKASLEFLGGFQSYKMVFYTYSTSDGSRVEKLPAKLQVNPVVEFNIGIAI